LPEKDKKPLATIIRWQGGPRQGFFSYLRKDIWELAALCAAAAACAGADGGMAGDTPM